MSASTRLIAAVASFLGASYVLAEPAFGAVCRARARRLGSRRSALVAGAALAGATFLLPGTAEAETVSLVCPESDGVTGRLTSADTPLTINVSNLTTGGQVQIYLRRDGGNQAFSPTVSISSSGSAVVNPTSFASTTITNSGNPGEPFFFDVTTANAGTKTFTIPYESGSLGLTMTAFCVGGANPELTTTKSVNTSVSGSGPYGVGDTLTYDIVATNNGNVSLTNVSVNDTSPGAVFGTCTPTTPVASLAPGASVTCSATHVVTEADVIAGSYSNTAVADSDETEPSQGPSTVTNFVEPPPASLSLTKTADQASFDENDSTIGYTYTVENTGSATLTNIRVDDDKIASVSCNATTLGAGVQTTCTGTYQVMPVDVLLGEVTNNATAYGTDQSPDNVTSNTETETVSYVGQTVEEAVDEASSAFIMRRMDRLMDDGPDRARLLRKRADRVFCGPDGSGADVGEIYIDADDEGMNASGAMGCSVLGGSGQGEAASPYDLWIEGNFTVYDSDTGDGSFGVAYVGFDWLVNERFLVGVLAQFDWMSLDEDSESDVDGFGWMVGPYMSAEIFDNVFVDARFAWGLSDNDITVTLSDNPFSGDFDTERWLASLGVSGNYSNGSWRLTPGVAVSYMEERRKTFSVSGDGGATSTTINSETFALGRLTFGPELAYRYVSGAITFEPQVSMRLIWDFHSQGDADIAGMTVYDTGVRGAVEVGGAFRHESGVSARISGKYDGIGTGGGLDAWSIGGWLNIPF